MVIQHFRIHGVPIEITAPGGALTDEVRGLLCPFASYGSCDPACKIFIRSGKPPLSHDEMRLVDRLVLPSGREIQCYSGEDKRITMVSGRSWYFLDLKRRLGEIVVQPGEEWCLESDSLTPILCEIFARDHHHVFHAATLVGQTAAGPRAIILAGVSGVGKTTTSLALAHAGLTLLADDATFLVRRDGSLKVWGFPRPCKVHRNSLAMMEWLAKLEDNPVWRSDEFLLSTRKL